VRNRHFVWEPGVYQLHVNLVNSEKIIGSSAVLHVAYAHAQLNCPKQIAKTDPHFVLEYILDYHEVLHPASDWIGIFPKNSPNYTPQAALQRLMVGPENTGFIVVEAEELEAECEICYFQDYGACDRILGKTSIQCVQRAACGEPSGVEHDSEVLAVEPKTRGTLTAYTRKVTSAAMRHIRFYVCGTFLDMQVNEC